MTDTSPVKEVGSAITHLKPGDQVILSYSHCRRCRYCSRGESPYCENLRSLNFFGKRNDGSIAARDAEGKPINNFFFGQSSMSRLVLAHESCAIKVECSAEELKKFAALGCGIQTGAGTILYVLAVQLAQSKFCARTNLCSNVCKPPPLSSIAIFGAGTVGIAAALAAKLTCPARLVIIDHADTKLNIIPGGIVTGTLNSAGLQESEIAEKLLKTTNGIGFDYVIDCVGLAQLVNAGHQALAPRGMVLTVGGPPSAASISLSAQLLGGRTYRGTHQGDSVPDTVRNGQQKARHFGLTPSLQFIPKMIDLWRQGRCSRCLAITRLMNKQGNFPSISSSRSMSLTKSRRQFQICIQAKFLSLCS